MSGCGEGRRGRIVAAKDITGLGTGDPLSEIVLQPIAEGVASMHQLSNSRDHRFCTNSHAARLGEYKRLAGTSWRAIHRSILAGSTLLPLT